MAGVAGIEATPPQVRAQARQPRGSTSTASTQPAAADGLQLRVRRLPNAVELVLVEAGLGASLSQQPLGNQWLGELRTSRAQTLKVGPQALALPGDGMERISFEGSGTSFRLTVTASSGRTLPEPVVSSDGRDLVVRFAAAPNVASQTASPDLRRPSPVPNPAFVPPLRPRAVAPPLGDMAVGTMTLRNRGFINLSGPPVTLNTRGANARDVLMLLAQLGGYGFAFSDLVGSQESQGNQRTPGPGGSQVATSIPPVTVAFKNEPFASAFNSVLMATGLQARKESNSRTIFVGYNVLSKTFGSQVSKVYRLNQVGANSAADYLANLGAQVTKTNTISTSVTAGGDVNQPAGAPNNATTTSSTTTNVEAYGASTGPLLGLQATTDSRLSTITLIGEKYLIDVAEQYLKQLDLRQRQVALSVRILDVNLGNGSQISNSFAFRSGNSFILNENGSLSAYFGDVTPSGADNPGLTYPNGQLVDELKAVILSTSTKVLASPTLILSENAEEIRGGAEVAAISGGSGGTSSSAATIGRPFANEAFVTVGEQLVTSFTTQSSSSGAPPVCTPVFSNAGLTFGARVSKIDDNGFVTFSLSPEISAAVGQPQTVVGCGAIRTINRRRLDTGNLRVRDGQTLILTGVINDDTQAIVSKWPILGDIPFIGQFFRSSNTNRRKSELVIMVTPRIVDDEAGGSYGYGYRPSTDEARQLFYGTGPQ